jgi:uncharacterized protein (DUF1499 family)
MQILIILVGIVVLYGLALVVIPLVSPMPDGLGVTEGQLKPCPGTPNCVSTQADPDDRMHYIEPIPMNGTVQEAKTRIVTIINAMDRSTIITDAPNYLHIEFRSLMMRFIDDVEFYFDEDADLIHFRSAARLGVGDGGVNRRRMNTIRDRYTAS